MGKVTELPTTFVIWVQSFKEVWHSPSMDEPRRRVIWQRQVNDKMEHVPSNDNRGDA